MVTSCDTTGHTETGPSSNNKSTKKFPWGHFSVVLCRPERSLASLAGPRFPPYRFHPPFSVTAWGLKRLGPRVFPPTIAPRSRGKNCRVQVEDTADAEEPRELRPPSVQGDQHEEADDGDRGLEGLGAADVACELANVVVEVPVLVEAWQRGVQKPQNI